MSIIIKKSIEEELREAYLTYSLSSLIRALPSVEDGITPIKRRSLYIARYKVPANTLVKSVKLTGLILGIHQHGESSVYNHLVLNARPDKTNYPLYISQGNFGNISGDKQAAYRYTEIMLAPIAKDIFFNRNMEDVATRDAFDVIENAQVFEVNRLSTSVPAALLNGMSGIAVGFSTNLPSHELGAVIDTTIQYIKKPTIREKTLAKTIGLFNIADDRYKGFIANTTKVIKGHTEGKSGGINVYPHYHWERSSHGSVSLVLTSVPYKKYIDNYLETLKKAVVNKTVNDKKHPYNAIRDLVDESAKDIRIRIVISTRHQGIKPNQVFDTLLRGGLLNGRESYLNTFNVGNVPMILNIKGIIGGWLMYRRETLAKYYKLKNKYNNKIANNYRGLITVLPTIKKAISIIVDSKNETDCISKLMKKYSGLTNTQCKYIMSINLKSYINKGLNISNQLNALEKEILLNDSYINSKKDMDNLIIKELRQIRKEYVDDKVSRNIITAEEYMEMKRKLVKLHLTKFNNLSKENSFTKMLTMLSELELAKL